MKDINDHTLNQLKKRFVSDYNIPIIIFEHGDFEYFLDLYEGQFESRTKWNQLLEIIDEKYSGNPNLFLEEFSRVRNSMIDSIESNEYYKEFIDHSNDLSKYNIPKLEYSSSNVYKETNDGRYFLSIDLKKANFSALMYYNCKIFDVSEPISYDKWVNKFTDLDYIKDSKYTRQVVFGKLNPSRQIKIEKYMIYQVLLQYQELFQCLNIEKVDVVSFCTDEIVFDVTDNIEYITKNMYAINHLQESIKKDDNISVDIELYKLKLQQFKTYKDSKIDVYMKTLIEYKDRGKFNSVSYDLFSVPSFYYAQIYKLIHGMNINETDLKFYMEGQIARFYHPLIYVNSMLTKI